MSNYDESVFRRDWESRYASSGGRYDDYEPAYRYGSYLARNDRWRGRQWNEIEPDIRNEWEASHPKGTWEKFKDSIRYGWESMTGQSMAGQSMTGQRDRQTETFGVTGGYGGYDDSPYRSHWQSKYGSSDERYDDYEPAYRYGSYLAGNERWRGRQWNEIEPDIRNEWEAGHPKGTWERFKDAIRYGWEGMAGQRDRSTTRQTGAFGGHGGYDESIFRRDWESRYASSGGRYEDYEPAYRYGYYLAGSGRWRGRQWNEIEPDVRNEWEASHPRGTWERFKDSIRYGWESMTGQRDRQMGTSGGYDESVFRRDWESRYASSGGRYEDYEPAYRYGYYLAGSGRWRGRQWNEIEPDVRNEWEASHPRGTWERFKDAIRYGWESMTGMGRPMQPSSTAMRGGAHVPEDIDRHRDWQHSYWSSGGRSDDYAPAFRYGADYGDNDTNPNHQWSDVEPRMRSDWETYNRESGSWERNLDAIRYGWEKGKQHIRGTHSGHSLR